jgi:mRNA interferase MazF
VNRGDIYLVRKPGTSDTKKRRAFVVVSRPALIDSSFSTVICAPVYSSRSGLSTQVNLGPEVGLKHECAVFCDELVSLERARLTDFIGAVPSVKLDDLDRALSIALGLH